MSRTLLLTTKVVREYPLLYVDKSFLADIVIQFSG